MGVVAGAGAGAGAATSTLTGTGAAVGGVFVAAALILLLATYNLYDVSDRADDRVRSLLLTGIVPLAIVFAAIVAFQSLAVIS